MKVTPNVFEASLKCPTKCWLRATGESSAGNTYAEWVRAQNDSYRTTGTERLISEFASNEVARAPTLENVMVAKWRLASSLAVQAKIDSYVLEAELHAVECLPTEDLVKLAEFIPIRFVFTNKIGNDDKLLLGFDVFALWASLGREIGTGKIIHGDDRTIVSAKSSAVVGEVRKRIEIIAAMLSTATPPELVLNRHCTECEFRDRCRQQAKETDDLSLLSGMSEKERARHRSKGSSRSRTRNAAVQYDPAVAVESGLNSVQMGWQGAALPCTSAPHALLEALNTDGQTCEGGHAVISCQQAQSATPRA